jgi:branched-chain amino acid transport system substrate-binding protein
MKRRLIISSLLLGAWATVPGAIHAAETIRIAHIDPMSGPFAVAGTALGHHTKATADEINAKGGVLGGTKFEIVLMDSKSNPQEASLAVKQAVDQGIRFITQGAGSNVAHALVEAISKHNARNPESSILFMNFAAQDPALTNEKCNFWHFRFDAHVDMKLEAITSYIAKQKNIKRVYLFNQDYAFGQAISKAAREMLAKKRPDIQIVGDDLHPLGKVKDFAPYMPKIKASNADAVITGNWGPDFSLLIKASKDAGLGVTYYTLNAHNTGIPTSVGEAGADHIRQVFTWHANVTENRAEKFANDYKKRFSEDFFYNTAKTELEMLAKAIDQAGSADPLKVARALEGMKYNGDTGEVWMRREDHQLIQPIYLATFTKAGGPGVRYDAEGTGYGWRTDVRVEPADTVLPTTCKMERP